MVFLFSKVKLFVVAFWGLILLLFFQSCVTPAPVLRVKPSQSNVCYYQGKAYQNDYKDSINVVIAFDRREGQFLIFDVEVANLSYNQVALINPGTFAYDISLDTVFTPLRYYKRSVIDPEDELLRNEMNASQRIAQSKNSELTTSIVSGVAIAGLTTAAVVQTTSASSSNKSTSNDYSQNTANQVQAEVLLETAGLIAQSTIISAEQHRYQRQMVNVALSNEHNGLARRLRITHLFPQKAVRGEIKVKLLPYESVLKRRFRIGMPIEKAFFSFSFDEIWHKVTLDDTY